MKRQNPLSIKKIDVKKLFGHYSYTVPLDNKTDISELMIIYGDNGSGKTTLLNLLFWILSVRDKSGYKSMIAETKFKSFSIYFKNGIEIGVSRKGSNIIGGYTYYVKRKEKTLLTVDLKASPENSISLDETSTENFILQKILNFIKDLDISLFFLTDDRKILSSLTSSANEADEYHYLLYDRDLVLTQNEYRRRNKKMDERKLGLQDAIGRLNEWIVTKSISGSKTGEKNSQVIYTDLIKSVLHPSEKMNNAKTKDELTDEIDEIDKKIAPYVKLGLIERFDSKTIKATINSVETAAQLKNLRTIIAPYIDSINAKLNAYKQLKDIIDLFLNTINSYFTNKEIAFNLITGFKLTQFGDEIISFDLLSSGEKQLLLLFIYTITSAEAATIFIIDEPEISLNIKWQRSLIDTLLKFSIKKNIQYILSTHSLELLSSNLDLVTKLENENG